MMIWSRLRNTFAFSASAAWPQNCWKVKYISLQHLQVDHHWMNEWLFYELNKLKQKQNKSWSEPPVKRYHFVKSVRILSFPGLYFPAFGQNTERYFVSLRLQSECGKIRTKKLQIRTLFVQCINQINEAPHFWLKHVCSMVSKSKIQLAAISSLKLYYCS